jgi:hypothetical protein
MIIDVWLSPNGYIIIMFAGWVCISEAALFFSAVWPDAPITRAVPENNRRKGKA